MLDLGHRHSRGWHGLCYLCSVSKRQWLLLPRWASITSPFNSERRPTTFYLKGQLAARVKAPVIDGSSASEVANRFADEIPKDQPLNLEGSVGYLGSRRGASIGDAFLQSPARSVFAGVGRAEGIGEDVITHVSTGTTHAVPITGTYRCSALLLQLVRRRLICAPYRINLMKYSTKSAVFNLSVFISEKMVVIGGVIHEWLDNANLHTIPFRDLFFQYLPLKSMHRLVRGKGKESSTDMGLGRWSDP